MSRSSRRRRRHAGRVGKIDAAGDKYTNKTRPDWGRKLQSVEGRSIFVHVAHLIIKQYNTGLRTPALKLKFELPDALTGVLRWK